MFQKFNTDTLLSRFIKNLLANTSIPLLDVVHDGDYIIEGCTYLYNHKIINCTKSGTVKNIATAEKLYPSEDLFPSDYLYPEIGIAPAQYEVQEEFREHKHARNSYRYKSNVHWYDSATHKHLGNYLRYLRDLHGLDLMPFYNCYSAQELTDVALNIPEKDHLRPSNSLFPNTGVYPGMLYDFDTNERTFEFGQNSNYKVIAIPVKFNKFYTFAIESDTDIYLRAVIYGDNGMVKIAEKDDEYYSDLLSNTYVTRASSHFNEPFLYKVETQNKELYSRQRDLYVILQISASNTSSIVVLEGDYTAEVAISTDSSSVRSYSIINPVLLAFNTQQQYAFSDRLVEYLLNNVITHEDQLSSNIVRVQQQLIQKDDYYRKLFTQNKTSAGVWDDQIRSATYRFISSQLKNYTLFDQDGYVNKDIEKLLMERSNV